MAELVKGRLSRKIPERTEMAHAKKKGNKALCQQCAIKAVENAENA